MDIQFLTGTDSTTFVQTLLLLQSFAAAGSGDCLGVCDFGMTEAQRRFLAERGQLRTAPNLPPARRHPWYQKAALGDFIGKMPEGLVWLDADMLVTRDLRPLVGEIVADMRRRDEDVAACHDDCGFDIETFLVTAARSGRNVKPFLRLLLKERIGLHHPYLNTGFIVFASPAVLEAWRCLTFEVDQHFLFDQSSFNTAAWRAPARVRVLDWRQWNVHGHALGRVEEDPDGNGLCCDGQVSHVLHATSPGGAQHTLKAYDWTMAGERRRANVKVFRNPLLRRVQLAMLQQFMAERQGNDALWL